MPPPRRLVFVGEVVLDVTTWISSLPAPGGDMVADEAAMTPGGGFNVMAAAARQGIPVLFAGRHGEGVAGDTVRAALAIEGIEVLRDVDRTGDTGFVVTMVQPDGERTFVTSADALRGGGDLGAVPAVAGDVVYVSGYGLAAAHGTALAAWVGSLGAGITVIVDPGPLVADVPGPTLEAVLARADWWSCNRREATTLTGVEDALGAAPALARRLARGGVVVRDGASGCVLVEHALPDGVALAAGGDGVGLAADRGSDRAGLAAGRDGVGLAADRGSDRAGLAAGRDAAQRIAAPAVDVVDTTGAGDTHVGVFGAGLACGRDPLEAARWATVAATMSVTQRGPATAPSRDLLHRWMHDHG